MSTPIAFPVNERIPIPVKYGCSSALMATLQRELGDCSGLREKPDELRGEKAEA